jgi:hypothetical protein
VRKNVSLLPDLHLNVETNGDKLAAVRVLSARVILRLASLLLVGLFGRSKVERASVLLAVKKTSVEYIVRISGIILSVVDTIFMIEQSFFFYF